MTDLPSPRPVTEPAPVTPRGNSLARALRAIVNERRLPTRVQDSLDRSLIALGRPFKTIEAGGLRFQVRRQAADEHFVADVLRGIYTPPGYEIGETDIVIDVGGNIGAFAVWAGRLAPKGRVFSLEPAAENFAILASNVRLNRLTNVEPINAALSDRPGTVTLHLAQRSSGDHTINRFLIGDARGAEQVDAIILPDLLERHRLERCDFIKFNCEGGEVPVIHSLDSATAARLRRIVLGYHTNQGEDKRSQSDALARRLLDLGFTIDDYTDVIGTNRGTIFARRD